MLAEYKVGVEEAQERDLPRKNKVDFDYVSIPCDCTMRNCTPRRSGAGNGDALWLFCLTEEKQVHMS